jgi:hypothetical protein
MNGKSPNNTSKWQMGFNSAFKGLIGTVIRERLIFWEMIVSGIVRDRIKIV